MKYVTIILFTMGLLWLFPQYGQSQLVEVKQTVFGMDCAPCAYALETRTEAMDGIESASVSLNKGLLTAKLAQSNSLTLKQIRKAVEESGFSPREVEIRVTGTILKENDRYVLITPAEEKYELKIEKGTNEERIFGIQAGEKITLTGLIPEEPVTETKYWVLTVDNPGS